MADMVPYGIDRATGRGRSVAAGDTLVDPSGTPLGGTSGVTARLNSGVATTARTQLNYIEGAGISISVVDDGVDSEIEVTITASLSNSVPVASSQAAGSAGVATSASRSDHRHPFSGTKLSYQSVGVDVGMSFIPGFTPRILFAHIMANGGARPNYGVAFNTGNEQYHTDCGALLGTNGTIANTDGPGSYWSVTSFSSSLIQITRISGAESWTYARVAVFGEAV